MLALAGPARAAAPPLILDAWAENVTASSATLATEINPNGGAVTTSYRFDYINEASYQANLAKGAAGEKGFAGAARTTPLSLGKGSTAVKSSRPLSSLAPDTTYRYRAIAANGEGESELPPFPAPAQRFRTQRLFVARTDCPNQAFRATGAAARLPDCRAYEMVSPVDKNGGAVGAPGTVAGGGVLQAASGGGAVTFSSATSFGEAQGAPPGSQYVSSRGRAGWSTQNISAPLVSGSYGPAPEGVPYQIFSEDLSRALMLDPRHCGEDAQCLLSYSLRSSGALLAGTPAAPGLHLVGASADLAHAVLSTCAAFTADAIEVPEGEGCDAAKPNLYKWSGSGLSLVNLLLGDAQGTPGAGLGAQSGAISNGGSRVYWTSFEDGNLYLREGSQPKQVDAAAGGGGSFQTASTDGSVAFYLGAGHLYRYEAPGAGSSTDLTPSGGVAGVLGASANGSYVYYQDGGGLKLWREGVTVAVAAGAAVAGPGDYPPTTGTARVSADGTKLLFVSSASPTGYDNADTLTGGPDSEVYLYDATAPALVCISCNPTNERPSGASTIPGSYRNGAGPGAVDSYKPRVLSAGGHRVFFESADPLLPGDRNATGDVYEWEAQGAGDCTDDSSGFDPSSGGCLSLISGGETGGPSSFADASANGADAFFVTGQSLAKADSGSLDLYDAREGGGFPQPLEPIPCEGDACQILPSEPVDPALTTLIPGRGNPKARYRKLKHRRSKHRHRAGHRHERGRRGR